VFGQKRELGTDSEMLQEQAARIVKVPSDAISGDLRCSMRKLIVAIVISLTGCSMSADKTVAEGAVTSFHTKLDAGQFDTIYADSSEDLKSVTTHEKLVALLEAVHKKLGATKSSKEQSWNVNFHTSGTFITLTYATSYESGDASEQFVYRLQGANALLAGYHINADALILK
jgi:hypothetical protein